MSRHRHTLHTQMYTRSEGQRDRPTRGQVRALQKYAGAHIWRAHVWLTRGREHSYADTHRRPICHQAHGPPDKRSWQLCSVWPWASPDPTCLGPVSACGPWALGPGGPQPSMLAFRKTSSHGTNPAPARPRGPERRL